MFLSDFQIVRPKYEERQETILDWIVAAHSQAEGPIKEASFESELKKKLFKLGLGEKKIKKRGFHLNDCNHRDWDQMRIYNVGASPHGAQLDERMSVFDEAASSMFEEIYQGDAPLPSHIIHTTCTGYVAPSPAQKLVSLREHGNKTMVTHAYHMGCYGSIPSIRIAMGHFAVEKTKTDIVHTELCSLHMNPTMHTTEQLVVQSLFGDGCIKYSVGDADKNCLEILSIHEEIISGTSDKMTWNLKNWGFQMSISKDIPALLRRSLEGYLQRLCKKAGVSDFANARYAIHPGGPKIIEQIAEKLDLKESQFSHSLEILQNYGNMSSATLPHVWELMLEDDKVLPGELIVSLAFGPGLSICGGLFRKCSI